MTSSIMTNGSAIAALDRLRTLDHNLDSTQNRVSSGFRVAAANDDAAYWSITTTMRSDDKAMAAAEDALAFGKAKVEVAYLGMSKAVDIMSETISKLVAAREPGVDKVKINSEIEQLRDQMRSIADSSTFNGQNWLVTEDGSLEENKQIVSGFLRNSDGQVGVQSIDYGAGSAGVPNRLIDESANAVYGILTQSGVASGWDVNIPSYAFMTGENPDPNAREFSLDNDTTNDEIDTMIDGAEYMFAQLTDAAAVLGARSARIDMQANQLKELRDTNTKSIGQLRDADMNEEATRLKAIQTQKQLGLQSLSIANANADNVMQLFR